MAAVSESCVRAAGPGSIQHAVEYRTVIRESAPCCMCAAPCFAAGALLVSWSCGDSRFFNCVGSFGCADR